MKARARTHVFAYWGHRRRSAASRCVLFALLILLSLQVLVPSAYALEFSDVPADHMYAAAISDLASRGVISGLPDGSFRPDEPANLQQFAKMIVKTLSISTSALETTPFMDPEDLDSSDPLYPDRYLAVYYELALAEAETADTLAPYETVTYQQLLDMFARAADLEDPPATYTPPFGASQFDSSDYYLNARKASYAGLLTGFRDMGASFDFLGTASRGECAQLLSNLLLFAESPEDQTAYSLSEHSMATSQKQEFADDAPAAVVAGAATFPSAGRTFQHPYGLAGVCVAILGVVAGVFLLIRSRRHHEKPSLNSAVGDVDTKEHAQAVLEKWVQEQAIPSSLSSNLADYSPEDAPTLGLSRAPTSISIAKEFDRLLEQAGKSQKTSQS